MSKAMTAHEWAQACEDAEQAEYLLAWQTRKGKHPMNGERIFEWALWLALGVFVALLAGHALGWW